VYVHEIAEEFHNAQSFKWQNFRDAAIFCVTSKAHVDHGLAWADRAARRRGKSRHCWVFPRHPHGSCSG
jgi:hypothetical protein